MDTNNQIFLTSLYEPDLFIKATIGINNFFDQNEVFSNKNKSQRNEFNLFKMVKIHDSKILYKKDGTTFKLVRPQECSSCQESSGSICDAGTYCSDETPICEKKDEKEDMVERQLLTQSSADILFKEQLYYDLRDNLMKNYNIGNKYIDYYYALSAFLQKSDYTITTLYKMISALPELNDSILKLLGNSSNNEIIISEQLKNNVVSIINDLKLISSNADFQTILNELESDIIFLSNKTKSNLINELH